MQNIFLLDSVIAILIVIIQFIPVSRENPEVQGTPGFNNERTRELVRQACYDCHSHETDWPWYAYVAPVCWLVASDVNEGREHFNMSVPPFDHGDEAAEMVEKDAMPLDIYQWMHPEARFSDKEKQDLIGGLKVIFGQSGENGHEEHEH